MFGRLNLTEMATELDCYQTPRKSVPIAFLDLLLELQVQILSLLEWDDVLCVRRVGFPLHKPMISLLESPFFLVSTRPVGTSTMSPWLDRYWLALFKWYSATVFPQPICLEKPLDLYSDVELEYLILRWQKTKVC